MASRLRFVPSLKWLTACLAALVIAGCGGGDDNETCSDSPSRDPRLPNCSTSPPSGVAVASVEVLVSSPQIGTDGGATVAVTIRALNANRAGVVGRPVTVSVSDPANSAFVANFSPASSGGTYPTDANGQITATLNPGASKANRTISVRATVDGVSASSSVLVTGTTLKITGSNTVGVGSSTPLGLLLADSAGVPIVDAPLDVASANGNALTPQAPVTDSAGVARVTVTGARAGADTITASGLGASASLSLNVSNDTFAFTTPAPGTVQQVGVNVGQAVVVRWTSSGAGVSGAPVNFSATRGTLSAAQVFTAANGEALVTITSPFAGPATVTAFGANGLTASANVRFVAGNTPAKIDLQADRTTVPVNAAGSSANVANLHAVVRDVADNLIQGALVTFHIEQDTSGGALSAASVVTDVNGLARIQYIPSTNPSQTNGVSIRATVRDASGNAVASAQVVLTVGGIRLFVRIGTDNTIAVARPNYIKTYSAFVTDAGGNPVPGATVQFLLRTRQDVAFEPARVGDAAYVARFLVRNTNPPPGIAPSFDYGYAKGRWLRGTPWVQQITAWCFNEDVNGNGILDPGEDQNGNGSLQPGNVFSVVQSAQTNAAGYALADITYPADQAAWVNVTLKATALVAGTEASESATFTLPILASDIGNADVTPPGVVSPYGQSPSCADRN